MAYMTKEGKGPYPCYEGEFCGNYNPNHELYRRQGTTLWQAEYEQKMYLARMRFGRPRACGVDTIAELAAQGYVGLYLKKDDEYRLPGEVLVDTPEELREPVASE
jgi:hypothetical protein